MTGLGSLSQLWSISLDALLRFRLRTGLSILGIVIGVAAFIAMLSVSEGGRRAALRQVERLGLRTLVIHHDDADTARQPLRADDVERLPALVSAVVRAAGVVTTLSRVAGPSGVVDAPVFGVTADYLELRQHAVTRGRLLTVHDDGARPVCVVGAGLARRLFGDRDPVGSLVSVDGRWLTLAGVLDTTPAEAGDDQAVHAADHDGAVLVPLPVLFGTQDLTPGRSLQQIWLETAPDSDPLLVKSAVERALAVVHRDTPFRVTAAQELLAQRLQTQRIFNVVVGSVAVLTLLVGGIGIMNILLASVLERTQEIGLRRTVGATRSSILLQFLVESVTMTATGGVLGLLAGAVVATAVTAYAGWPTYVSMSAVGVALTAASLLGIAFGIYPAVRAARLEPIDAVRWE